MSELIFHLIREATPGPRWRRLFDAVWPGVVVEENTLQVHMSALRKALGPGFIATVHGRGYKYVGPEPVEDDAPLRPGPAAAEGNIGRYRCDCVAREVEIMRPYHDAIDRLLDQRRAANMPTAVVCMHSCTPRLAADMKFRPWHIGVIAHHDWRIGEPLLALLAEEPELCVGRNEPYNVDIEVDYTVPVHCEGRGLPYVEIEIRQDLIGVEAGQREWAERLARILPRIVDRWGVPGA